VPSYKQLGLKPNLTLLLCGNSNGHHNTPQHGPKNIETHNRTGESELRDTDNAIIDDIENKFQLF